MLVALNQRYLSPMSRSSTYVGIRDDHYGGMTEIGRIIRDAWVFGILPESETCAGWDLGRLDQLYAQVHQAWEPYGHLVSRLPPALRERHQRIYGAALEQARAQGWSVELDDED